MASFWSRSLNLSYQNYDLIHQAIQKTFNIDIAYNVINAIFRLYIREYFAYKLFLGWVRPQKVFVSMDLQKGLYVAAKEQNIPVVNYGMAIAYMNGILDRALEIFRE